MPKAILFACFASLCAGSTSASDLRQEVQELMKQRDYYGVVETATEAVNFYKDDSTLAQVYLQRGQAQQKRRNLNHAFADFEVAYSIDPDSIRIMADYGNALAAGYSGEQDWDQGIELLRKAAELNDAQAQYQLAIHNIIRRTATKENTVDLLVKAANQDHMEALLQLAQFYQYGQFVNKDRARALHYYRILAALNHPQGRYYLALAHYTGSGVKKDPARFERLNNLAASQWHPGALNARGNVLGNKHELEAGNLFFRASTFGYDPAEVNLGSAYLRGFGVDQNFKLARYWFEKAGQTPRAQELLGILSLLGLGAEQDMEAAFEYFKQASGLGQQRVSQLSYSQLAVLSEMGVGDFHDEFYDRWRQQLSSLGEASTLNSIVWALSTNPIPELNRPEIALELARRLQKNTEEPAYLDSVAAALAINGEFKEASKIQKKVIAALTGTREYQEAKRRYQGYKRKRAWVEDYKQDKPSRHKETSRTVAVVTGEIIRSDEQRPETAPAFRIGAQPEWVVPVLVKEVVEGSLPYTMKEYAYFVLSGVSAFSEDCGDPIPEGINTFTLTERLSSDGWQYEFAMDCPR